MNFKFDVHISDKDYYEFNKFVAFKSKQGRKRMLFYRLFLAIVIALSILRKEVDESRLIATIIAYIFTIIIIQILFTVMLKLSLIINMKVSKANNKLNYSPNSVIEFYDDKFIETTPLNKSEVLYSAIHEVSVVNEKYIYLHLSSVLFYIIPFSSFESKKQYDEFIEFLKTKYQNIDYYNK